MDMRDTHNTQQLLAEISQHFSFIPPVFLALQTAPELLFAFWQQIQTNYVNNPLPHLFKEKLFLALSYHSRSPYDLRSHCITLHRLGIQEQEILTFLRTPLPSVKEIEHTLQTIATLTPLTSWHQKDQQLEITLLTCSTHLFLKAERAEGCRVALQRFLGIHYLYLSAVLATINLYHHWVGTFYELLSTSDECSIPQQFRSHFPQSTELADFLQEHHARCVFEERNRDQRKTDEILDLQQREQRTNRALSALLALAEVLVLGPDETTKTPDQEEAWTANSTLKRILDLTQNILGCKHISLMTTHVDTDRLQPVALVGFSFQQERSWWHRVPETNLLDQLHDPELVERVKQGEVLVLDTRQASFQHLVSTYGNYTWMVAPMLLGQQLVGLLSLDYGTYEHTYTEEEIRAAGAIARLFALILEHEHLLQERAEAQAREIALTKTNERINAFLGVAGHELKTPLTSIKGNIQLLQRRLQREQEIENETVLADIQTILQRADQQVDRLTRLVRDIIEVSRIHAKRLKMHLHPQNITSLLTSTIQQQRQQTPQRTILLNMPEIELYASLDTDYIEQVITNYLSNALKYSTGDKPVKVTLETDEKQMRISVQDEGPGIAYEEQELIWESFYQAQGSRVRSGSGIGFGLGLFICRSIVEEHGGEVGVQSQPGEGSIFWFSLPRILPEDQS